jgi:hypothetical protein
MMVVEWLVVRKIKVPTGRSQLIYWKNRLGRTLRPDYGVEYHLETLNTGLMISNLKSFLS